MTLCDKEDLQPVQYIHLYFIYIQIKIKISFFVLVIFVLHNENGYLLNKYFKGSGYTSGDPTLSKLLK